MNIGTTLNNIPVQTSSSPSMGASVKKENNTQNIQKDSIAITNKAEEKLVTGKEMINACESGKTEPPPLINTILGAGFGALFGISAATCPGGTAIYSSIITGTYGGTLTALALEEKFSSEGLSTLGFVGGFAAGVGLTYATFVSAASLIGVGGCAAVGALIGVACQHIIK